MGGHPQRRGGGGEDGRDQSRTCRKTYFAWSGATTNGGLAYYRIQGPTVVIEYAPQQGDLDHIHTIYRDPTNDYGAGLVKK